MVLYFWLFLSLLSGLKDSGALGFQSLRSNPFGVRLNGSHNISLPVLRILDGNKETVSEACSSSNFNYERCQDFFAQKIDDVCGGAVAEDLGSYPKIAKDRGRRGMRNFLFGMSGLAGKENHLQFLLSQEDTTSDFMKDWGVDWVKDLWFWFIFMAISILWAVAVVVWSPLLCSHRYRKWFGKHLCCDRCCNYRFPRTRPIQSVKEKKIRCIEWWYIIFVLAVLGAFAVVAIVYGGVLHHDMKNAECVLWRSGYVTMFGISTTTAEEPHFVGIYKLPNILLQMSYELDGMSEDLDAVSTKLDTETTEEADDYLVRIEDFQTSLEGTLTAMTTTEYEYSTWDNAGSTAFPTFHSCITCDVVGSAEISTEEIAAQLHGGIQTAKDGVSSVDSDYIDPLQAQAVTIAEDLAIEIDEIDDTVFDVFGEIVSHEEWIDLGTKLAPVVFILIPFFILLGWLGALIIFWFLWRHLRNNTEPSTKKMRNGFCALWFWFAFSGCLLLFFGIFGFILTQPLAEGCDIVYKDFFSSNKYFDYAMVTDLFGGERYSNLSRECFTYDGEGKLMDALALDFPMLAPLYDIDGTMAQVNNDLHNAVHEPMDEIREMLSIVDNDVRASSWVHAHSRTADLRYNILFQEGLFGSLQRENSLQETLATSLSTHFSSIQARASQAIAETEFLPTAPNTATLQAEVDSWTSETTIFGLDSLGARLQLVVNELDCGGSGTVCLTYSDEDPCCEAGDTCFNIDGSRNAMIPGDEDSLNMEDIISSEENGALSDLLQCMVDRAGTNSEQVAKVFMWITSFVIANIRMRLLSGGDGAGYVFRIVDEAVSYDVFTDYVDDSWTEIYEMPTLEAAFDNVLNNTAAITADVVQLVDTTEYEISCRDFFTEAELLGAYTCDVIAGDVAMTALCWSLLSLGSLVGVILTWRLFHYFADRKFEDDEFKRRGAYFSRPSVLLKNVKDGDIEAVAKCCAYQEANDAHDENMNGGLHLAAYYGNAEACQLLLAQGCNPNRENKLGYTPLDTGVSAGHPYIVKILVDNGANLRTIDPFGDTPIHTAARQGDRPLLKALLSGEHTTEPPENMESQTPMGAAASLNHQDIVTYLDDFYSGRRSRISSIASSEAFPFVVSGSKERIPPVLLATKETMS